MNSTPSISIIDYKAGNIRSVQKALEECGASAHITSDADEIIAADGVVFPGQGACDASMQSIRERGLFDVIRRSIDSGKPFLGVCLGLQLLLESSEEGDESCLAILKGSTKRLPPEKTERVGLKIPHMGWNSVAISDSHPSLCGIDSGSYFYFVHSFYAEPSEQAGVAGMTEYGLPFCSVYARGNVVATQFHPEKSGDNGLRIYANFVEQVTEECRR